MLYNASYPFEYKREAGLLHRRLAEFTRSLNTMMEACAISADYHEADEFVAEIMQLLCKQYNAALAVAWTFHAVDQCLEYKMHVDMQKIETADFINLLKARRVQAGESLLGQAVAEGIPMSSTIITNKLAAKAGFKSEFVVPLRNRYRVIGALEFYSRKSLKLSDSAVQFMNELGMRIGIDLEEKLELARLRAIQIEHENLQHQLRRTADEAIESARLKSEFVANVSHEVRTPLAGIMGMAEMLASNESLDAESKELASYILSSSHSLLSIVNDLLDFSKLEAGKLALYKTWFSVAELVESIARSARASADKKGLMVRTRLDHHLPDKLFGDSARLTQILMNFAHNAVKFTDKGEINITADLESTLGNVVRVKFLVGDTGIGISREAQKRLFEPFVQADGSTTRRFGGTGLGLSIAKKLTQLMNGDIGLDSEEGVGSSFYVIIPLEQEIERMVG